MIKILSISGCDFYRSKRHSVVDECYGGVVHSVASFCKILSHNLNVTDINLKLVQQNMLDAIIKDA